MGIGYRAHNLCSKVSSHRINEFSKPRSIRKGVEKGIPV
jgi:hypothetical protein